MNTFLQTTKNIGVVITIIGSGYFLNNLCSHTRAHFSKLFTAGFPVHVSYTANHGYGQNNKPCYALAFILAHKPY
jgi:hypothetical protein